MAYWITIVLCLLSALSMVGADVQPCSKMGWPTCLPGETVNCCPEGTKHHCMVYNDTTRVDKCFRPWYCQRGSRGFPLDQNTCIACPRGYYQDVSDVPSYEPCKRKIRCKGAGVYFREADEDYTTVDRRCRCNITAGFFLLSGKDYYNQASDAGDMGCSQLQLPCPAGQGLKVEHGKTGVCAPCPPGYFTAQEDYLPCKPWRHCLLEDLVQGNPQPSATRNAVCVERQTAIPTGPPQTTSTYTHVITEKADDGIKKEGKEETKEEKKEVKKEGKTAAGSEEESASFPVWAIVVTVVLFIFLLGAVITVIYMRRRGSGTSGRQQLPNGGIYCEHIRQPTYDPCPVPSDEPTDDYARIDEQRSSPPPSYNNRPAGSSTHGSYPASQPEGISNGVACGGDFDQTMHKEPESARYLDFGGYGSVSQSGASGVSQAMEPPGPLQGPEEDSGYPPSHGY